MGELKKQLELHQYREVKETNGKYYGKKEKLVEVLIPDVFISHHQQVADATGISLDKQLRLSGYNEAYEQEGKYYGKRYEVAEEEIPTDLIEAEQIKANLSDVEAEFDSAFNSQISNREFQRITFDLADNGGAAVDGSEWVKAMYVELDRLKAELNSSGKLSTANYPRFFK